LPNQAAKPYRRVFRASLRWTQLLGPGLITGAADDDPSGIGTYSIAGAQAGFGLIWMAWVTWPLMAAVQMMCARVGMVSNEGLARVLCRKFPRWLVLLAALALLVANMLNIAADLSAMADAAGELSGWGGHLWVVFFALVITGTTVRFRYRKIAVVLKWLALSLGAYVAAAFFIHPHWGLLLRHAFLPAPIHGRAGWTTAVAILGTTISPYLFFWQTAQEVEERQANARRRKVADASPSGRLRNRRIDVAVGTFASNLVMFFVILTCAETLHRAGITEIAGTKDAAAALKPLAGNAATLLYTLGIVGTGLLAIPTMAGSAAYALSDVFQWKSSLDARIGGARAFYAVLIGTMLCAAGVDFVRFNPIKALYWSAVVNGLLAPVLLGGLLVVAADRKLMKNQRSSALSFGLVAAATLAMLGAAIGMWVA
jgi:NRAMP (natural resistance-associated macrophage protein)-like metal ion transporter